MSESTDMGILNTDNITNNPVPQLSVTCIAGNMVKVYENTTLIGAGACMGDTAFIAPTQKLSDGIHELTARQTHPKTNVTSIPSGKLTASIDTISPTTPTSLRFV